MRIMRKARSSRYVSHACLICLVVPLVILTLLLNLMVLLSLIKDKNNGAAKSSNPFSQLCDHYSSGWMLKKNNLGASARNGTEIYNQASATERSDMGASDINHDSAEDGGRQHILDIFQEAEVNLTNNQIEALPTWYQVQKVVGRQPRILNLESCSEYRDIVPPLERMLGSAGPFNTGTNLVTHLLKQNCEIPERREEFGPHQSKENYGMRWQVPWGKHTPAKFRNHHSTEKARKIKKEYILPVVTMRDPYSWFRSMCNNGYAARWKHGQQKNCPNLRDSKLQGNPWNPVHVRYGDGREDDHTSLAHMWNDWYGYYLNEADYPFVVVRMEDLVFYPKETIRKVCECAGGKIRTDQSFKFIVESAKADSPGHDKTTGIYQAWMKYSKPAPIMGGLEESDFVDSRSALNQTLMNLMGYPHPPSQNQ